MLWDSVTSEPIGNAIVWQDTRTASVLADYGDIDTFRDRTGLPLATYFSAPKLRWLLDQHRHTSVMAGTMDSWLIYKLTGRHATDVTNASRTMLMNLSTLDWDELAPVRVRHRSRDPAVDRPLVRATSPRSPPGRCAACPSRACSATSKPP